MDETVLKSESEDGELETCQQVNLNVVKVEDTSMDIKPPPDSVPGIISAPVCDISKPPYDCKLEPHADDTTPLLPPFLVPVCGVPQQSSSELPQVAPGQPLVMPLNPGGLVPLQPVCMVPGGSSTLGQPYFITPQGLSVQNVNPAYGPIHGVGFTLNGQCATLLSAAPGAQFVNSVVDAFRFQPSPAVPHTSTFPVVLDADPLTTVASTTVSSTSSTVVSAHTELGSTKGGPKKDDVLSRMDETELKSECEDGELETCQQYGIEMKVEDASEDVKPPPDAAPGVVSTHACDISTPSVACKLKRLSNGPTKDRMAKAPAKFTKKRNFTACELEVLLTEVEARHSILNGNLLVGITNKRKMLEWQGVAEAVNAVGPEHRTVLEIKKKWTDIKVEVKKRVAAHRKSLGATCCGRLAVAPLTPFHQRVASIMRRTIPSDGMPAYEGEWDVMQETAVEGESSGALPAPEEEDDAGEPAASTSLASRPRAARAGRSHTVRVLTYAVLQSQRAIAAAIMSTNEQLRQMTAVLTDISQSLKELVKK